MPVDYDIDITVVVASVISHIQDFIQFKNWQALDDEMAVLDITELSDHALIAWCRATHPFTGVLPSREGFVAACYEEIKSRRTEEEANRLMKGMVGN